MSAAEQHHFQAEIEQVLDIVIHSLYTDKEIFVRELISNAADACEKLRFLQSSGQAVFDPDRKLGITVTTDDKEHTITFVDAGVGMTHGELVENLGTVAHSGSRAFLKKLAEDKDSGKKPDAQLIGQFGVGFYSAFMVATKVTVYSRSHLPEESGWCWTSEGARGFSLEPAADLPRGTKIVLQLSEAARDFAKDYTIERIVRRYSNFVPFPIELNGKAINTVQAIWTRNKSEIKEEEYQEFYKYLGHDSENAMFRLHFTADAPLSIQALLFVPSKNMEFLGMMRTESEVHLYCKKVLIDAKPKGLLPEWLRFLKGVVDSEDLPLNISRETMQDSSLMQKLNQVLTGRFLKMVEEQAEKDPAQYEKFYAQFGRFLKEGVVNDYSHHEALGKLLRFESSSLDAGQKTSLADYVKRMTGDQKEIYYLLAASRDAALGSPGFEVFRSKKYEVLLLDDPWDEFVMDHLREFDSKPLKSAEKAELAAEVPSEGGLSEEDAKALGAWMKEALKDRVAEVKPSQRLVDSPAILVDQDKFMTASMRRLMKAVRTGDGKEDSAKYELQFNPKHNLVVRLQQLRQSDAELATQVTEQILDNARFAAGLIENPSAMLKRMNDLLERVVGGQMILCLGTTPAVQRVMVFRALTLDAVNRALTTLDGAAGKSINVAKVLSALDAHPLAVGFLGGDRGECVRAALEERGIEHEFVRVAARTRQCLTVLDQTARTQTELVEESQAVAPADYDLLASIARRRLPGCRALILSGTLTPGGPVDFYARATAWAEEAGALSVVDAQGKPLLEALNARPGLVKPNRVELSATVQRELPDESAVLRAMRELRERGAQRVVVTAGKGATLAYDGLAAWRVSSPKIDALNPIGSGDAFTAALTWRLVEGDDLGEACRWGAAAGAANALTAMAGEVRRPDVDRLAQEVAVERLTSGA